MYSKRVGKFRCNICDINFTFKANLKRHNLNIHHKDRKRIRHECTICFNNYSTVDYLRKHIRVVHENGNRVECHDCGKIYKSRSNLVAHIHYKHSVRGVQNNFTCDYCKREFNRKTNLEYHIRYGICYSNPASTVRSTVFCPYCSKSMLQTSLRTHLLHCPVKFDLVAKLRRKPRKNRGNARKPNFKIQNSTVEDKDIPMMKSVKAHRINCNALNILNVPNSTRAMRKRKRVDYKKLDDGFSESDNTELDDLSNKNFQNDDPLSLLPKDDLKQGSVIKLESVDVEDLVPLYEEVKYDVTLESKEKFPINVEETHNKALDHRQIKVEDGEVEPAEKFYRLIGLI